MSTETDLVGQKVAALRTILGEFEHHDKRLRAIAGEAEKELGEKDDVSSKIVLSLWGEFSQTVFPLMRSLAQAVVEIEEADRDADYDEEEEEGEDEEGGDEDGEGGEDLGSVLVPEDAETLLGVLDSFKMLIDQMINAVPADQKHLFDKFVEAQTVGRELVEELREDPEEETETDDGAASN